jgi:hypothetical protein
MYSRRHGGHTSAVSTHFAISENILGRADPVAQVTQKDPSRKGRGHEPGLRALQPPPGKCLSL